ncbi:MAG: thioredoxin family protein [Terrimicrobiaceae bacterium]|nr:thioredoxin family protein [Terrimicrobiaceae bacterium]
MGGLILNLMPCVLPVISLKIFGFLKQAGEDRRKIFLHGLAFTAGIFAWFGGLGVVVSALKAGGAQVTWAFQFQNAWFNLAICAVVFVFALNLFGVFEITLPGRAATALDEAGGAEGYGGSFFQGVFATLLATPCTAPFLGTALGFAFSQSVPVIFAMFGAVAAGMASPYILLAAQPAWMKFLPRPGVWMERVKQFMGFPLLATLLWLLWILGSQKGSEAVIWAGAFLLCLGLAAWLYGAFCGPGSGVRTRLAALAAAAAAAIGGGWFFAGHLFASAARPAEASQPARGGIAWEKFTRASLDRLLEEGRGVFLDFTADWCITCKVNERTAIDRPAVRAKLKETGIVPMKADWTNPNPEIAEALRQFGRVGVPFYVIYPPGRPGEPIVLPELLTEAIVLDGLARAAAGSR